MKRTAFVVLLAMGTLAFSNSFAQDRTVKRTSTKTISAKNSNKPGGTRLTKRQTQNTTMVSAKKQSANR